MRRVIAALLRLYPARFRRALGEDMLATFDEQWRERAHIEQPSQQTVERPKLQAHLAMRLALDRLHDAVAVERACRQAEKNVKIGRLERKQIARIVHISNSNILALLIDGRMPRKLVACRLQT